MKFKQTGHRELMRKLQTLDRKMRRSISGKALRAESKVTVRALRSAAPKDTGAGAKAIGTKVKTYRGSLVTAAISGERFHKRRPGKETKAKYGAPHLHLSDAGTGERFHTGSKAASKSKDATAVRQAKRLRNIQSRINKLGSLGRPLVRMTANKLGKKSTGRVLARPFFKRAWRGSIAAGQAAKVAVLKRELESAARGA